MNAAEERESWIAAVREVGEQRNLRYEEVGGINPKDAPPALCPGGSNRLTGELVPGTWGASCDADEREEGSFMRKSVLPHALLAKSYMPELTRVVPVFHVESIEFNRRFLATVPSDHDPMALRQLFSPAFLDWTTTVDREVDFGSSDQQIYFNWRLRERTGAELRLALKNACELFEKVRRELNEAGEHTYPPGPWNAALEPFPDGIQPG